MKTFLRFLVFIMGVLCAAPVSASESSPAGTWKWIVQNRPGGQGFEQTLHLEFKDGKLTGTLFGMQGDQVSIPDTAISDASFEENTVTFAVKREFNGNVFTTRYQGTLVGDVIKGFYERPGLNGREPVKREWEAKR